MDTIIKMTVKIYFILDVPYNKKEEAKEKAKLRWDPNDKTWYATLEDRDINHMKQNIDNDEELPISYYAYGYRLISIQDPNKYLTEKDLYKLTHKFTKSRNNFIDKENKKVKDEREKIIKDKARHELGLCVDCDNRIIKDMTRCLDCDF